MNNDTQSTPCSRDGSLESVQAEIFLSCGQNKTERRYAADVKTKLKTLGFRVFLAAEVETYEELLQVIHPKLRDADYFVFVDFRREKIQKGKKSFFRGSLYSHQELAIANYLNVEFASFREVGVEPHAGISSTIMGNGTWFNGRAKLASKIHEVIRAKCDAGFWSNTSKNRLELKLIPDGKDELQNGQRSLKCFQLEVKNLHHRKRATNCYAYIDRLVVNGAMRQQKRSELKWRGVRMPAVTIWPNEEGQESMRELDAFVIERGDPNTLLFETLTDAPQSSGFVPEPIVGKAEVEISYVVCSAEFPDARGTFRFSYDGDETIKVV